ncbi:hypothetical protein ACN47E_001075 [Coniothyrium glycines]
MHQHTGRTPGLNHTECSGTLRAELPVNSTGSNSSHAKTGFLHLPGELRNAIYARAIFQALPQVQVVNCTLKHHVGGSALSPSIFRVSRQVRAEAMSHLCANKIIQILGLATANAFFEAIGPAAFQIKSLVLVQPGRDLADLDTLAVERFFNFLAEVNALKELRFQVTGTRTKFSNYNDHLDYFDQKIKALERHGVKIVFEQI